MEKFVSQNSVGRFVAVLAFLVLQGCVTANENHTGPISFKESSGTTVPDQAINQGVEAYRQGHYKQALRIFNAGLQRDITNSSLQCLSGMTYHALATKGDGQYYDLAAVAYTLAAEYEPTNWVAHWGLGMLALEQKHYGSAKLHLSTAAFYRDSDVEVLYPLAVAAYYDQDLGMAAGILDRILLIDRSNPEFLRAATFAQAGLGNKTSAEKLFEEFSAVETSETEISKTLRRYKDWSEFSDFAYTQINYSAPGLAEIVPDSVQSGNGAELVATEESDPSAPENSTASASPPNTSGMIALDVVIVRTEENISTRKGVNLLNGLELAFGVGTGDFLTYKESRSLLNNTTAPTKALTKQISIPGFKHVLNILNAGHTRDEILARPTLTAKHGETATFFSGRSIKGVVVSSGTAGGSTIKLDAEIGVKLAVTPKFLENEMLEIGVTAERTFLVPASTTIEGIANQINLSETKLTSVVVMAFGETLVLGGLSEKEDSVVRDGVPFLEDIPIVQYLFSTQSTVDFHKSVLVLITPRRAHHVSKPNADYTAPPSHTGAGADTQFIARHGGWFENYPSLASTFKHMHDDNSLYREFRTGDLSMEEWKTMESFQGRLERSLDFLLY